MVLVLINYTKPYEEVAKVVAEHRAFLGKHYEAGTLVVSGPRATKTGGIVLARGKSAAEVAEIFKHDPYALHGVATHEVIEFDAVKHAPGFEPFL